VASSCLIQSFTIPNLLSTWAWLQGENKTTIIDTVKTIFEELREANKDYTAESDFRKVWEVALDTEKKAESFYREKIAEVDDENNKRILKKIADEEHNHWVAIENVIQFLDKPTRWLEDAEWNNLETFWSG